MHKRLTRILSAVAFLAVIPAVSFGSARVAGLNVPGDYVKDYTGIFTYVSGVGSVGNLVYVEPSNTGNDAMGAVLGNLFEGRLGTWGVNLRRFAPALGQPLLNGSLNPSTVGLGGDPNFNGEAFDLMWGRKMGSGSLGLRLNRSFQSIENTAGTTEGNGNFGRNIWGIGGGFGFAMNANTDVELSALFQNRGFKGSNAASANTAADNGGTTYQLAGRAMMKAGSNLVLMPVVKLHSFDLSSTDATLPTAIATDEKLTGWQAGLAGNWSIGSDDLFVLGAQIAGNHYTQKVGAGLELDAKETYYPNVFMAVETHVNSWLTLRFGAQNAMMYSLKTENAQPGDPTTIKGHTFNFNAGAGAKLGSLQLDATLENGFWNNPVSGVFNNGNSGNPFPQVTATYSF